MSASAIVGPGGESEIPSCQGCRRRKLRCSRDKPTCNHCQRLDSPCVYDAKKNKPGMKPGVIESLSRRVEALENTVYDSSRQDTNDLPSAPLSDTSQLVGAFSSLIQELRGLVSAPRTVAPLQAIHSSPEALHQTAPTPAQLSSVTEVAVVSPSHREPHSSHPPSRKRRRVDSCGNPNIELASQLGELGGSSNQLPPPELLEEIVTAYFNLIQPWIPVLHETRFRSRFYNHEQLPPLAVLLHAIVVAAIRFVDCDSHQLSAQEVETWMARSRSIVILSAMDGLAVENLQALSIIAFSDMGSGDVSRAWPSIGSLTRTVEYLQLSVEADDRQERPLLKPLPSIPPSKNWTQDEERRRVFWNIFNLDRLCSVMTGWNTSLTSDDVRRRLPADGGLWHKEETVLTPYFGIWDRSAARIGNSIVFLPAHYPSPEQTTDAPPGPETPLTTPTVPKGTTTVDMSTVGAFAYCIEATESLSQVTTYFLQQRINFKDRQEVSNWLTRFKELDLRLVHWKMFLPQKWKDSNISRRPTIINMDPNLTLAHITHNTSMILLHQQIAYPAPQWTTIVRMPSAHSAETCQIAASETATITQKYLKYTPNNSPVNSQFSFCVFVSARSLLVHWRYYKTDLAPEFWQLVESLEEMAKRWVGPILKEKHKHSLAGKYSAQLRALHKKCEEHPDFSLDVLGYSTDGFPPADIEANPGNETPQDQDSTLSKPQETQPVHQPQQLDSNINNVPTTMPMGQLNSLIQASPTNQNTEQHSPDELSAISTVLMDQGFMQLDRVISFDDMLFSAQTANDQGTAFQVDNWTLG
ncbi:Zn(2)-C6 fungal-type domain-containing protein [Fusarium keratoplasticum]|uniref:Zn(2)-C6 fungal-type domain-containing protein n=1 Tax=Fusarium keratoplasticum TaxID=1328300 RepID=A0ACC0QIJ1_9HYPO|nr:Zn(2)-C6 fungal-type domain-containing protein [Fusarium keratoplasticum]KAI8652544.1 Zn(2)-C6 fungal-type domain-containing protein [Fusarium keratoplasticum]